jgi:Flp pilus assembly protein TadG
MNFWAFYRHRRGNVAVIYALALPVLIFAIGLAIDFGRAAQIRTKLNAAADAATLAALTPNMLKQSPAVAQAAAAQMFQGLISGISALAPNSTTVTATVYNPDNNGLIRNVTVTYTASTLNIFAGVLGVQTLQLGGTSTASAVIPPNIDFYLLLDNSPSMALPATQAGINQMQGLTGPELSGESGQQGGCALACHQASTNNADTAGNPCADGSAPTQNNGLYCDGWQGPQIDNYQLARNNGITLRLDELSSAVTTLMQTASSFGSSPTFSTAPNYRFAVNSMDSLWQIGFTNLMALTPNYQSGWAAASPNFGVMEMYGNNVSCLDSACDSGGAPGDVATNYDNALSSANSQMPDPGQGTNQPGDTPMEVLFIVTDGVEDEMSGATRLLQVINGGTSHDYCSDIKARGIKIAILYTDYLPLPADPYYNNNVAPFQSNIGPALQACASPNLFYDASIGANLGQALSSLFEAVVQNAHLTQ